MAQSFMPEQTTRSTSLRLLLASPIIWSVYHIVGYFLVEIACTTGLPSGRLLSVGTMTVLEAILTVLALGAVVVIGFLSFRRMREEDGNGAPDEQRERFLGMIGGLFSVVLALIILADGAAFLVLGPCGSSF